MNKARLFRSSRSQAMRLPNKFRFAGTEVVITPFGNGVLLLPASNPWQTLQAGMDAFEPTWRQRESSSWQSIPHPIHRT